jgi:hypothetical protein
VLRHALAGGLLLLACLPVPAAERYRAADVLPDGRLRLETRDGRTVWAPRDTQREEQPQAAFAEARIAPDGALVGWLALYPACCQSYPIPLELTLFRNGTVLRSLTGAGMPIWHWRFVDHGRAVAFVQRPTHGVAPDHYELREVASGRLIAEFDHDDGDRAPLPRWTRGIAPPGE